MLSLLIFHPVADKEIRHLSATFLLIAEYVRFATDAFGDCRMELASIFPYFYWEYCPLLNVVLLVLIT